MAFRAATLAAMLAAARRRAQAMCLFEDRVEHRLKVARRVIDDLQHLGGRRLLLQCFVTLDFALCIGGGRGFPERRFAILECSRNHGRLPAREPHLFGVDIEAARAWGRAWRKAPSFPSPACQN